MNDFMSGLVLGFVIGALVIFIPVSMALRVGCSRGLANSAWFYTQIRNRVRSGELKDETLDDLAREKGKTS